MSEKKPRSKKLIVVVAIILVIAICIVSCGVLAVGAAVVGIAVMNSPKIVAANALKGAVEDVFEREEIEPLYKTLTGGSVQFHVSDIRCYDEDGLDEIEDFYLEGKLYMSKDALMLENFNYSENSTHLYGEAYLSKDEIYVYESNILGNSYGAKFSDLADDLASSIFAADSGSKYAMSKETYENVMKALEQSDAYKSMEKDANKLAKDVVDDIWKIVIDNATVESENTDVRIGGEKTKARVITISIDYRQAEEITRSVYEYLSESDDIIDFLEEYEDVLVVAFGIEYDEFKYRSLAEYYEEEMREARDNVDEMCDELRDEFKELTLTVVTPTMSSKLQKLELRFDAGYGEDLIFSIDCGSKGIKKADTITFKSYDTTMVYTVSESSSNRISASLEVSSTYSDSVNKFYIDIDKNSNTYIAGFETEYEGMETQYDPYYNFSYELYYTYYTYVEIRGDYRTSGDTTTLTVNNITQIDGKDYVDDSLANDYRDEYMIELNAEFIIDTKDKMPSARRGYMGIDDISEYDIEMWEQKVSAPGEEENNEPEYVTEPGYDYYY